MQHLVIFRPQSLSHLFQAGWSGNAAGTQVEYGLCRTPSRLHNDSVTSVSQYACAFRGLRRQAPANQLAVVAATALLVSSRCPQLGLRVHLHLHQPPAHAHSGHSSHYALLEHDDLHARWKAPAGTRARGQEDCRQHRGRSSMGRRNSVGLEHRLLDKDIPWLKCVSILWCDSCAVMFSVTLSQHACVGEFMRDVTED